MFFSVVVAHSVQIKTNKASFAVQKAEEKFHNYFEVCSISVTINERSLQHTVQNLQQMTREGLFWAVQVNHKTTDYLKSSCQM